MQHAGSLKLRSFFRESGRSYSQVLSGQNATVGLDEVTRRTCLMDCPADRSGRSVFLATSDQLTTALALIELNGVVDRVVLCPPGVDPRYFETIVSEAEADLIICNDSFSDFRH